MSKLTTHVLDTHSGRPASGLRIDLHAESDAGPELVISQVTNADGRCAAPMLEGERMRKGRYRLTFYVADYFRALNVVLSDPPFIDRAVVHFGIGHPDQNYHVPLLVTPWSYSVYRGS